MAVLRLHHVALPFPGGPDKSDVARQFYGGLLDLDELPVPPPLNATLLWFSVGDGQIHLFADPEGTAAIAGTRHHPCLQVDDLAAVRRRLTASGAEIIEAGAEIPGRERFFVRDPFGNALELAEIA